MLEFEALSKLDHHPQPAGGEVRVQSGSAIIALEILRMLSTFSKTCNCAMKAGRKEAEPRELKSRKREIWPPGLPRSRRIFYVAGTNCLNGTSE
jgi:hypothetical protein